MVGDLRALFNSSKKKKKKDDDLGFSTEDQFFSGNNNNNNNNFSGTHSEWDVFDTNLDSSGEDNGLRTTLVKKKKSPRYEGDRRPRNKRKIENDDDDEVVDIEYEIIVPQTKTFRKEVLDEDNLLPESNQITPNMSSHSSSRSSPSERQSEPYMDELMGLEPHIFSRFQSPSHSPLGRSEISGCKPNYTCFFCKFYKYSSQINEGPVRVLLDYINERVFQVGFEELSVEVYKFYMNEIYPEASRINREIPKMTEISFLEHIHEHEKYRDLNINYVTGIDILTKLRDEAANASIYTKIYKSGLREKIINTKYTDDVRKSQAMIIKLANENPKLTQLGQRSQYSFGRSGVLNNGAKITARYAEYRNQYNEERKNKKR